MNIQRELAELERRAKRRKREEEAIVKAKVLFWHGVGLAVANGILLALRWRARRG